MSKSPDLANLRAPRKTKLITSLFPACCVLPAFVCPKGRIIAHLPFSSKLSSHYDRTILVFFFLLELPGRPRKNQRRKEEAQEPVVGAASLCLYLSGCPPPLHLFTELYSVIPLPFALHPEEVRKGRPQIVKNAQKRGLRRRSFSSNVDDTTTVYTQVPTKAFNHARRGFWVKVGTHEDLKNLEMCVLSRLSETR